MTGFKIEAVTVERLRTHCCACQYPFSVGRSMAMRLGFNSGHATCPQCDEFLHVEQLEGDQAWTERWADYVTRTGDEAMRDKQLWREFEKQQSTGGS